jgi:hypothetical protein
LGRILPNTENGRAEKLLLAFAKMDKGHSPEVYLALVRIVQRQNDGADKPELKDWRQYSTLAQIVGEFALIEPISETGKKMKAEAPVMMRPLVKAFAEADPVAEANTIKAAPDALQAYARFKTEDLGEIARLALKNKDIQIRAAAAGILADLPLPAAKPNEFPRAVENIEALSAALKYALENDVDSNDAILAILDALAKLDPAGGRLWLSATNSPDYLVRKRAMDLIPKLPSSLSSVNPITSDELQGKPGFLERYSGKGTKLGQVLNTDADYRRALSRKNGTVSAVITTAKGAFTIDLLPEDAPLTVDNFIKLANAKYFNGVEVHRVVPNFVMQDGDPRGDGNGGPGWTIRCEINMVPYERGAVGMALSGKDTGGRSGS